MGLIVQVTDLTPVDDGSADDKDRRIAQLEQALAQSKKLEVLGIMAGVIAHDFNNVLAAVSGSFHVLERTAIEPKSQIFIQQGKRSLERATRLVRQLMHFARNKKTEAQVLDLGELILGCCDLLKLSAGAQVRVIVEPPARCFACVDSHQLEAALLNLTLNARDAMPNGGDLTINILDRSATEALSGGGGASGCVAICVRDTGTGMPPEVLARAHEPFFTTKAVGEGSGLGLAMVNAFARQYGGSLKLKSAPGQGTTAIIVLPYVEGPAGVGNGI